MEPKGDLSQAKNSLQFVGLLKRCNIQYSHTCYFPYRDLPRLDLKTLCNQDVNASALGSNR